MSALLDTFVVNMQNDTLVVTLGSNLSTAGIRMDPVVTNEQDTARSGIATRPPLLFLAALLLGLVSDHLVPLPFPIPRIGAAHWISAAFAGCLMLIGVALFAASVR